MGDEMLHSFHKPLTEIPIVWIDTETTGVVPGVDAVVQLGIARFEPGQDCINMHSFLVNPGRPIPAEATTVHGITDEMVADSPPLADFIPELQRLSKDAQPGAYNAPFDSAFMPPRLFDRDWPWLDCLTLVRVVDRFARGKGRHKLESACQRHGIPMTTAHSAGCDAEAAGNLFRKLIATNRGLVPETLGDALRWFEVQRAEEWFRFNEWLSRQPALED